MPVPPEPVVFNKWTSALCGPDDVVQIPRGSLKTDWEVELAVVIGQGGRYISENEAMNHVAGYCVMNDVSERDFQLNRSGTWDKGKGCDTFGPLGPWLVTADEVPDPHNLSLWLEVDGQRMQDGNTATMVYKVPFLISYLSQFMSLQPGDVISTGTPPGVGMGHKPPGVFARRANHAVERSRAGSTIAKGASGMTLKICVAQLNLVVGDMAGNARKIIKSAQAAYKDGARLVLTPELSICGYAAEDLFLRSAFISACDEAVVSVAEALADLKDLCVVVGHPTGGDQRTRSVAVQTRLNAASVLCEGHVVATYAKRELPNYQVFDERRYFTPGQEVCVFEVGEPGNRLKVGLLICEDAWFDAPARETAQAGAELLVVINASPFHVGKGHEREQMMRQRVLACGLPLVYAHLVGGQDEVVFEGHSFALNANGGLAGRAPSFIENNLLVQVDKAHAAIHLEAKIEPDRSSDADLWDALVLGVRDYINKNGFPGVLLGLSGGSILRWYWRLRGCFGERAGACGDDAIALYR